MESAIHVQLPLGYRPTDRQKDTNHPQTLTANDMPIRRDPVLTAGIVLQSFLPMDFAKSTQLAF